MPHRAKSRVATASLAAECRQTKQLARIFSFISFGLIATALLAIAAGVKVDFIYMIMAVQAVALLGFSTLYGFSKKK
ncbi:MAG: hypothetical protein NBV76_06715 [Candidatus Ochrobactrum gambitense]|nr:MAG: hypothetical protein NBV76_06715 [Candidatus Ochrobactrum gambitense]WEK16958.1 MAG: hypothetical protein P0Y54_04245 [Candidatus Ochrobactrum gambitense]